LQSVLKLLCHMVTFGTYLGRLSNALPFTSLCNATGHIVGRKHLSMSFLSIDSLRACKYGRVEKRKREREREREALFDSYFKMYCGMPNAMSRCI